VHDPFDLMMHLERACQAQVAALAGGAQVVTPSRQVAQKVAAQFARPGRQAPMNAWAALLRMLDREDATYRE
jgi:ribulose-5-phosphate 4-epimerase/fuculose-1-phosphate aldolase